MYCYQCEEKIQDQACTIAGACGKSGEVAALQDVLLAVAKGVAWLLKNTNQTDAVAQDYILEALFTTVTNVDFDPARLNEIIDRGLVIRSGLNEIYDGVASPVALFAVPADYEARIPLADELVLEKRQERCGVDAAGVQELILYGLKGAASYADHARVLGYGTQEIADGFTDMLAYLCDESTDVMELFGKALAVGDLNMKVMELLDGANTGTYGHPEPTSVKTSGIKGKALLVSGHDLKDLQMILEQTEGTGVNVYTHSEMLPANAYPELKKFPHLAGNFGGAWQDQKKDFDAFPGSIVMTTNCIQKPKESYEARIFTTGLVAWPGVPHIGQNEDGSKDFGIAIEAALEADGFAADQEAKEITVGFGHNAVLDVADVVVDAVKSGAIKHFFLIGGCDGYKLSRVYYSELAAQVPEDCVILTLACGKYRFNKQDFGDIGGVPRLLDLGQCNDAYSAIRIASALADAFECGVNDLPLSLVLSWYEQKAISILLSLLNLGIKNIRIGPSLPAFLSPAVVDVLVEKYSISPISTPEKDLESILGVAV